MPFILRFKPELANYIWLAFVFHLELIKNLLKKSAKSLSTSQKLRNASVLTGKHAGKVSKTVYLDAYFQRLDRVIRSIGQIGLPS
jgi:hypothetical protein